MNISEEKQYTFQVIWSEEDEEYVGLCSEFPSLSWLAESPEEALRGVRQLVAGIIVDIAENGESIDFV